LIGMLNILPKKVIKSSITLQAKIYEQTFAYNEKELHLNFKIHD